MNYSIPFSLPLSLSLVLGVPVVSFGKYSLLRSSRTLVTVFGTGGTGLSGQQDINEAVKEEIQMYQQLRVLTARLKQSETNVEFLEKKLETEREQFVMGEEEDAADSVGLHHQGFGLLKEELSMTKTLLTESKNREDQHKAEIERLKARLGACEGDGR